MNRLARLQKRYPAAFGAGLGILVASSAALAAWILLTGVGGSGGGKVGSSQISPAITLTPHFTTGDATVIPGSTGDVFADVTNNNQSATEKVTSLSVSSITATPSCDTSALSFTPDDNFIGRQFGGGISMGHVRIGGLTAGQNLDPACANADLVITFTGSTTP